jgi:hypothetical protein
VGLEHELTPVQDQGKDRREHFDTLFLSMSLILLCTCPTLRLNVCDLQSSALEICCYGTSAWSTSEFQRLLPQPFLNKQNLPGAFEQNDVERRIAEWCERRQFTEVV